MVKSGENSLVDKEVHVPTFKQNSTLSIDQPGMRDSPGVHHHTAGPHLVSRTADGRRVALARTSLPSSILPERKLPQIESGSSQPDVDDSYIAYIAEKRAGVQHLKMEYQKLNGLAAAAFQRGTGRGRSIYIPKSLNADQRYRNRESDFTRYYKILKGQIGQADEEDRQPSQRAAERYQDHAGEEDEYVLVDKQTANLDL